jgi:CHAT domain-containing protein
MQEFYRQRVSGKSKAEALRQAQLGLLSGRIKGEQTTSQKRGETSEKKGLYHYDKDPEAPYAHPYFWAPFLLIGNWK